MNGAATFSRAVFKTLHGPNPNTQIISHNGDININYASGINGMSFAQSNDDARSYLGVSGAGNINIISAGDISFESEVVAKFT